MKDMQLHHAPAIISHHVISYLSVIVIMLFLSISWQSFGQDKRPLANNLGIQSPLYLQKKAYKLVWSSHPDASLYKQEYLTAGDAFPSYKSMITIDFVITGSTVDDAVRVKVQELEQLKKTLDVNYEVIGNAATGEKIIDCLIGQTAADDSKSVYERDVYRFKAVKAKSGQKGILLYAASVRQYGKDIKPFLIKLKTEKPVLLNEVAKLSLPEINISK
jgi:hypothetical protein